MDHKKRDASLEKDSFLKNFQFIEGEIKKRRGKWSLTAISWMDYSDVSQIIILHVWQKWYQYNPKKPLGPWLNRIITNQIKNLIRDKYGNYSRPCLKCSAARNEDACILYGLQCADCPLYFNWENGGKKDAFNAKLPVSLEVCKSENSACPEYFFDISVAATRLHEKIRKHLSNIEWKVYKLLYMDQKTKNEVAREMGYITNEKNREPGYRQIRNLERSILHKVKQVIKEEDII